MPPWGSAAYAHQDLRETHFKGLAETYIKNIIKGMAHITGGGLYDNIPRILPDGCAVEVQRDLWEIPRIFYIIQDIGDVEDKEMFHVFNMGIGMTLVVARHDAKTVLRDLQTAGRTGSRYWRGGQRQ